MSIDKILNLLKEKIEKSRLQKERVIIFWIDLEKTYEGSLSTIDIPNFNIVVHNRYNQFFLKKLVEIDEPNSNFIIYRNEDIPENENWLIDIEKYSEYFSPEEISLLIDELEVPKALQNYFRKYKKFFSSKRKEAFKLLYNKNQNEKELLCNFYAVIFKTKSKSHYDILKTFILESIKGIDLLGELDKYDLKNSFEEFIKDEYGADLSQIEVKSFIKMLFLCHFDYKLRNSNFKELLHLNKNSAYLLIEYLLKDADFKEKIKPILSSMEDDKNVKEIMDSIGLEELVKIGTFDSIDSRILKKVLVETRNSNISTEYLLNLIGQRRSETYNFKAYETEYRVIELTLQFRIAIKEVKLSGDSSTGLFRSYTEEIYKIDSLYRKFSFEYENLKDKDDYLSLQQFMEIEYNNYYNRYLSEAWEIAAQKDDVFKTPVLDLQNNFFEREIMPFVRRKNKIFVIISDALRYEVAMELAENLSKESTDRVRVETNAMLGSIPSITKVGMAALLPQKKVQFNKGDITINDISVNGIANRQRILQDTVPESIAVSYKDIIGKSKEEIMELTRGLYVIYIYHDLIDAMGDSPKTEDRTFFAVNEAMKELKSLVFTLNNKANANNIYITADHGFLYQRSPLKEYNKLEKFDFDIVEQGKRYIVSEDKFDDESLLRFDTKGMFKNEKLNVYIPFRNTRIKQQGGGTKFVHGGISLQEVTIPLVKFKYLKNDIEKKQKVGVDLLNTNRIIANNFIILSFMQKDKVDPLNKIFGRKISIGIFDETLLISDEKVLILDSIDDKISSREVSAQLNLKNMKYELHKKYQLKIVDMEDDEVIEEYDFSIRFNNF